MANKQTQYFPRVVYHSPDWREIPWFQPSDTSPAKNYRLPSADCIRCPSGKILYHDWPSKILSDMEKVEVDRWHGVFSTTSRSGWSSFFCLRWISPRSTCSKEIRWGDITGWPALPALSPGIPGDSRTGRRYPCSRELMHLIPERIIPKAKMKWCKRK